MDASIQAPIPLLTLPVAIRYRVGAAGRQQNFLLSASQLCATLPSINWAPPPQRARRRVLAKENAMSMFRYRVGSAAANQQQSAVCAFLHYRAGGLCRCARNSAKQGPLPRLPPQHVSPSQGFEPSKRCRRHLLDLSRPHPPKGGHPTSSQLYAHDPCTSHPPTTARPRIRHRRRLPICSIHTPSPHPTPQAGAQNAHLPSLTTRRTPP